MAMLMSHPSGGSCSQQMGAIVVLRYLYSNVLFDPWEIYRIAQERTATPTSAFCSQSLTHIL